MYLVSLAALVSILGQPVGREHRSAVLLTLVFLGLGLAALTEQGAAQSVGVARAAGPHDRTAVPTAQRAAARPVVGHRDVRSRRGGGRIRGPVRRPACEHGVVDCCAVLLPLVPFHRGYVTALTRLPGNLPSFVVVLLPALGLHGLATVMPGVPAAAVTTIVVVASIGALYGAFKAVAQTQVRPLLAYGSLSLFSMMWWFAAATPAVTPSARCLRRRRVGGNERPVHRLAGDSHSLRRRRRPSAISGLVSTMPRFAVLLSLIALAVMGLPPFGVYAGFIGMAFTSPIVSWVAFAAVLIAWLTSSWYILDAVQSLLFGRHTHGSPPPGPGPFRARRAAGDRRHRAVAGHRPGRILVSESLIATDALRGWLTWHR